VEGGAHIVAGLEPANIVEAVTTIVSQPWKGRYELEQDFSPSTVVINSIRSRITNFF
jgi:UDP-N-acetylglucosamine 2-epimerase (non-hydrolysing)